MGTAKNIVIVRAVIDQGRTVAQTARRHRVSRQWVYTLLRRYRQGGTEALATRSRAPHHRPISIGAAVRARICRLREDLVAAGADAGAETIAWHLEREARPVPAASTIHRILRESGLVAAARDYQPQSPLRPGA